MGILGLQKTTLEEQEAKIKKDKETAEALLKQNKDKLKKIVMFI